MSFEDLKLRPELLQALKDCGYEIPTEIQERTIQAFTAGKHLVGQSQTGSGKTAAFVLPLLNAIDTRKREVQALILAPTRELASQIRDEIQTLSKHMRMMSLSAVGGTSRRRQIEVLRKGPQIVVGTPGRIQDLIESHVLRLQAVDYLVLDEVDRMLDMGFIDDIRRVWQRLDAIKQTMTFSATLPDEAKRLLSEFVGDDYTTIKISEQIVVDKVDHMFISLEKNEKYKFLQELLHNNPEAKVLVFAETKKRVETLAQMLHDDGFPVAALHGDMDQRERFRTLQAIKKDECRILVATDVAARGLNMNNVNIVVNYEVPNDPESYVHRIGRTARAGKTGSALMFISSEEWDALHQIERRNKLRIKQINHAGEEVTRTDLPKTSSSRSGGRWRRGGRPSGGRTWGRRPSGGGARSNTHQSSRGGARVYDNSSRSYQSSSSGTRSHESSSRFHQPSHGHGTGRPGTSGRGTAPVARGSQRTQRPSTQYSSGSRRSAPRSSRGRTAVR